MKRKFLTIVLGTLVLVIGLQSCEEEEFENETKISTYDSSESHNAGENCMSCHKPGGSGEGNFTVAGTVYESNTTSVYPNATISLYADPNGLKNLVATIQVDKKGNFYTTEYIDFGDELYATATGSSKVELMNMPVSSGQCNSCHGTSTDRIWVK